MLKPADPTKQPRACQKCKFAELQAMPGQIQRILVCMRFPPTMSMFLGPGPGGQGVALQGQTNHPVVSPTQWCHEFAEKDDRPVIEGVSQPS